MATNKTDLSYERFQQRYEEGQVPWDSPDPPPEVTALAHVLPPGRALDLGCGYGRTAIHLARLGWSVDGVDFVPLAISEARKRAAQAGVGEAARFHIASAADLPFLEPPYDLAVDIGCMHSFDEWVLLAYVRELARLLPTGAIYLLFAHLSDDDSEGCEDGPRGIAEERLHRSLRQRFTLDRAEYGMTQVEDRPPWNSAWFWFRRL